jgi:competence protein ComEC
MKRPLGIVALLYLGGLVLGNYFQPPLPCLFVISFAVLAGTLLLPRFRPFLIYPLVFFTAWTNFVWHSAVVSPMDLRLVLSGQPELARVRGTLLETPAERAYFYDTGESFSTRGRLKVAAVQRGTNWQPAVGEIEVITSGQLPDDIFNGRKVEVYGVLGPPPGPIAEGLFDFRNYLRRQEIYFQLRAKSAGDWQIVGAQTMSPPLSDRFMKWAKGALAIGRPNEDESLRLERALTLGDKTFLNEDVAEPFVRASTYHIFAVDGLRMVILSGMFFGLLRSLRVPRTVCGCILIPLIWSYAGLTGWPASAIRAAVMLTIVILGGMLKRPSDPLNSLYAAALLILLGQPQQLFQAGFQLSFMVVFCILLVMPAFDKVAQRLLQFDPLLPEELRPRWQRILHVPLRFVIGLFSTSLAAWLGSIPLAAYYFHIFTPVSALANVVAVPLCAAVLACNIASLMLAEWFHAGAAVLNYFGWLFMEWIRESSIWFANLPHAFAYVATPAYLTIFVSYAILLAALTGWLFEQNRRAWRIAGLALLCVAWSGQSFYEQATTRLTILPLKSGSAVYCDAPGAADDVLIDCGPDTAVDFITKPYLRAQGVNGLPRLALTHGDERQIDGFDKLQAAMRIEKVVTSPLSFRSRIYRDIIEGIGKTPGKREVVHAGERFGNWTALNPVETNHFARADDNALVLRGDFEGMRVLLLSDLGQPGQEALLGRNVDLRADIVVAGLPDEGEPLKDSLLEAIQPELIVITDSDLPEQRRASRTLRERLERRGVPVLCLRETDAVMVSMRSGTWKVETMRGGGEHPTSNTEHRTPNGIVSSTIKD